MTYSSFAIMMLDENSIFQLIEFSIIQDFLTTAFNNGNYKYVGLIELYKKCMFGRHILNFVLCDPHYKNK